MDLLLLKTRNGNHQVEQERVDYQYTNRLQQGMKSNFDGSFV